MKRQILEREDWDFANVPKNECADAWRWEILRELEKAHPGFALKRIEPRIAKLISKNQLLRKSFLSLHADLKSALFLPPEKKAHAFHEVPYERAPQTADEIAGEELMLHITCCGTHVVQIAWDQPKTRIIKEFAAWIAKHKEARQTGAGLAKFFEDPKDRCHIDPRTWLKDLAIYRVANAGFTSTEAGEFLVWISKTRTTAFSRFHFSDARAATRRRLENLAYLLKSSAKRNPEDLLDPLTVPIRWFL